MSDARRRVDWEGDVLPRARSREGAAVLRERSPSNEGRAPCGKMCAMRTVNQIMDGLTVDLDAE